MSLYDSSGIRLDTTADIFQGVQQTFTCEVQGTRPSVTIEWYLGGVRQSALVPQTSDGSGLTNTSATWTFVPTRENDGQMVMCVASTAESEPPFPSVSLTLRVNGEWKWPGLTTYI